MQHLLLLLVIIVIPLLGSRCDDKSKNGTIRANVLADPAGLEQGDLHGYIHNGEFNVLLGVPPDLEIPERPGQELPQRVIQDHLSFDWDGSDPNPYDIRIYWRSECKDMSPAFNLDEEEHPADEDIHHPYVTRIGLVDGRRVSYKRCQKNQELERYCVEIYDDRYVRRYYRRVNNRLILIKQERLWGWHCED